VPDAATYTAVETLRDGRQLVIRALKPGDRAEVLEAVNRASAQSLYRRFFGAKRHFSEREIEFFLNVDFARHVALVAEAEEQGRAVIVGGGRYVVVRPEAAEVAFTVVDPYQGQGIGTILVRHLAALAREAGLKELVAEVLPGNFPMLKAFENSGLRFSTQRKAQLVHVALQLC
jgi:RimJ/RimL family protein N-acetyltransferase